MVEEEEREKIYLVVPFPNGHNGQNWIWPKPAAWRPIKVSRRGSRNSSTSTISLYLPPGAGVEAEQTGLQPAH